VPEEVDRQFDAKDSNGVGIVIVCGAVVGLSMFWKEKARKAVSHAIIVRRISTSGAKEKWAYTRKRPATRPSRPPDNSNATKYHMSNPPPRKIAPKQLQYPVQDNICGSVGAKSLLMDHYLLIEDRIRKSSEGVRRGK